MVQYFKVLFRRVRRCLDSFTRSRFLQEINLKVIEHPPYSPDLAPCDFWLFPKLKEMLAGRHYESRTIIGCSVYQCTSMKDIPASEYREAFRKWIERCKRVISSQGEYIEDLTEKNKCLVTKVRSAMLFHEFMKYPSVLLVLLCHKTKSNTHFLYCTHMIGARNNDRFFMLFYYI